MNETDLQAITEKERALQGRFRHRVLCCTSTPCLASGAAEMKTGFTQAVKLRQLGKEVQVVNAGCMGLCSRGPLARVETPGQPDILFQQVTREVAERIVNEQLAPPAETVEEESSASVEPHDIPHFRASVAATRAPRGCS